MGTLRSAALAALVIAGAAQAQPSGHYPGLGAGYGYRYEPPRGYGPNGGYVPDPSRAADSYDRGYNSGYVAGRRAAAADAAAADAAAADAVAADAADVGVPMPGAVLDRPAYDRFGPDPNGTVAPDGHVIKCKIVEGWDNDNHRDNHRGRHRECW